jgi:hypothetical protein
MRLVALAAFAAHVGETALNAPSVAALVPLFLCRIVVVRDRNGQQLAYVYFEDEPGRRSAAKLLSKDEARRIAVNIAKLPDFCVNSGRCQAFPRSFELGYFDFGFRS